MRLAALAIVCACGSLQAESARTPIWDRALLESDVTRRAFVESMRNHPRPSPKIAEPLEVALPWVVYETNKGASTLPSAHPGQDYEVKGVIHQLVGGSQRYSLAVKGLPDGVEVLSRTLSGSREALESTDGNFKVALRLPKNLPAGVYPFSLQVLDGEEIVATSDAVVPVETLVDVIRVVAYNDFHGYIVPQWSGSQQSYSGALSMTIAIEKLRDELAEKDLILVSAGDTIGGTLFESAMNNDDPTKRISRLWDTKAVAAGNHEFDRGWEDLLDAKEKFNFPVLSANIKRKGTDTLFLDPTYVQTISRHGQEYKIGFVGVTVEALPTLVLASATEGLEVVPAGPEAAKHAARLKAEGCDIVICLFHQGGRSEFTSTDGFMNANSEVELTQFLRSINQQDSDIDILMTAHSHQLYNWAAESTINPRLPPVIQTQSFGTNLAVFDIKVNSVTRSIVRPVEARLASVRQPISYDFEEKRWVRGLSEPLSQAEVDALPKLLVDVLEEIVDAKTKADAVGLQRQAQSDIIWPEPVRSETILGVHIADAMLSAALGREDGVLMAFTNDGGIRKEWAPIDGHILVRHVYDTLPFSNSAVTMTLTGADIRRILEQQWIDITFGERIPFVLQISGMRYEYDQVHNGVGSRVDASSMEYYDPVRNLYVPIGMNAKYRVVTNSFLADGGDSFVNFRNGEDVRDLGIVDNEYTSQYNVNMSALNDGWLVPPIFENAIDKTKDMTRFVDVRVQVSYDFANMNSLETLTTKITLFYVTDHETIKGTFRAIISHSGTDEQLVTVFDEDAVISPDKPLELHLEVPYGPVDQPQIVVGLFHEVFDGSPLPRAIIRGVTLMPREEIPTPQPDTEIVTGFEPPTVPTEPPTVPTEPTTASPETATGQFAWFAAVLGLVVAFFI